MLFPSLWGHTCMCFFFFLPQLLSELAMHNKVSLSWGGNPEQWVLRVLVLHHCHPGYIWIPTGDFVGMVLNPWSCLFHSCHSYWLTGSQYFASCKFFFCLVGCFFFGGVFWVFLHTSCSKKKFKKKLYLMDCLTHLVKKWKTAEQAL